jgi:membrane protease subunit HflK
MQQVGGAVPAAVAPTTPTEAPGTTTGSVDIRSRDGQRSRDRDGR